MAPEERVVEEAPLEPADKRRTPRRPRAAKPEQVEISAGMVESAWQGGWLVLRFALGLFGFESDVKTLPQEEAKEDARDLVPIVRRHPVLARVLSWIGAPVVIVKRVMQHFHRRPPAGEEKRGGEKRSGKDAGAARAS